MALVPTANELVADFEVRKSGLGVMVTLAWSSSVATGGTVLPGVESGSN